MKAILLTPKQATERMHIMRPYLDGFAIRSKGRWEAHHLEADIAEGIRQAWWCIGDELMAVALTRVTAHGRCVEIDACAGRNAPAWRDVLLDEIEAQAREWGAEYVIPTVRPGWSKWLASRGYRNTHREMERRLRHG